MPFQATYRFKKVVTILGAHFTYDLRAKQKLNVDETISSIQEKLHIWRWRDLTIIGRIQIVKTFIIPIFLYRASLISVNREFLKDVNKINYLRFYLEGEGESQTLCPYK